MYHGKSKHIGIKYHFICELASHGDVEVIFCRKKYQVAEVLTTKALKDGDFLKMKEKMGLMQVQRII